MTRTRTPRRENTHKTAASGPCAPACTAAVPDSAAQTSALVRQVRLQDEDWARVTWRAVDPQRVWRPFDFELFVRHALSGAWSTRMGWERETAANAIPAELSQEEAWLWLHCINVAHAPHALQQPGLDVQLRSAYEKGMPNHEEVRTIVAHLAMRHEFFGYDMVQILAPYLKSAEIAAVIIRKAGCAPGDTPRHDGSPWPVLGFADTVAPYLLEPERAPLRTRLERAWDAEPPETPRARLLLALLATLGGGERLAAYVDRLPDGAWARPPANPLWQQWRSGYLDMLAGLPTEAAFVGAARRLGCLPRGPSDIRLWLAATEWRQLDAVRDAIIAAKHEHEAAMMVRLMGLAEAPETARAMLEVQLASRAPETAADWLDAHPQHTSAGLVPVAMGQGRLALAARAQLHKLQAQGHRPALAAATQMLAPGDAARLQREILSDASPGHIRPAELPAPLRLAFAGVRAGRGYDWVRPDTLPPISVQGRRLNAPQVGLILTALHDTPLGVGSGPAAQLLTVVKAQAQPASLDAFACQLFERWCEERDQSGADEWCMAAAGHLGGDGCVWKLTPLLHAWSDRRTAAQAMFGLACIGAIASPTALLALEGVARRHRVSTVKQYAIGILRRIAESRDLNREQLIDLSVPDCGLSAPGGRVLDYGKRQLQVVLGPQLTPLLRDASGKLRARPPACDRGDDRDCAKAALLEWQVLKKTLAETREMHVTRLEDAMINGRRWQPAELASMVSNPVMAGLLRSVVLAVYGDDGRLVGTFRVTEDQTLADHDDRERPLPEDGVIGVAHPAHLDDARRAAWGQLLGEYEIIPLFPQLARPVHRPDSEDLAGNEITRHRGVNVPDHLLRALLAKARFVHDTPPEALGFLLHTRHFPGARVTAVIRHVPVSAGPWHRELQRIDAVYFLPGHWCAVLPSEEDARHRLPIKAVDPGVLSEVLCLIHGAVSSS